MLGRIGWMILLVGLAWGVAEAAPVAVDEAPARAGEWGFRPVDGGVSARTPPAFSWRPQTGARFYELQASTDPSFARVDYEARDLGMNVHCPPRTFEVGAWAWRFRTRDAGGEVSAWSRVRRFVVPREAVVFPLPPREELIARVPTAHPRLFLRPEDLPALRKAAAGTSAAAWARLVKRCDALVASPPPTKEPPPYGDVQPRSEAWRKIWWGNRTTTIAVLDGAATLAFTWRLGDDERYGQLARRLLMETADWDPRGPTGYVTNDEAGMPFAYHFSRAYSLVHPLLTGLERKKCRAVMRIRGHEIYRHLFPRHLWRPYSSHANRAWHFLGEVAIAFLGEIPEAEDWLWFAVNVFANVYPVWSDDDGGWHEGLNYWKSYVGRFAWWAFAMRSALDLDAWRLPYFSRVGYYPMYLMPPGTLGGGFGDLNARIRSDANVGLMSVLAAQARNGHWQFYVDAHGGFRPPRGWTGFLVEAGETVAPRPPTDLPTARLFRGTGIAALGTSLLGAEDDVGILFKSSPFGSQSHGYEAQNAFLLRAYGDRLLVRSGRRDVYGSAHHRGWMWHTKSVNSITVNGESQVRHSPSAVGEITGFFTSEALHWVEGEAGRAYGPGVRRFRRGILFVQPGLVVIRDRLETSSPSTFELHLHAPMPFDVEENEAVLQGEHAACRVTFLEPRGLVITTTDRFDPPPRPRVQLVEHHLTAATVTKQSAVTFLTVIQVHRTGGAEPVPVSCQAIEGGWRVRAGHADVLVRRESRGTVSGGGLTCEAPVGALLRDASGAEVARYAVSGPVVK